MKAITTTELEVELVKTKYVQVCNSEKKKNKGNKGEVMNANSEYLSIAKANYTKALQAVEAAKLVITTEGEMAFELYGNLLSDEARQPWDKVIKAKVMQAPLDDIFGVLHTKTPTKSWSSFRECMRFHLQTVFCFDAGEALKYYIMNT